MNLDILKLTIPAALLCFAGSVLANPAAATKTTEAHAKTMAATSKSANSLGHMVQAKLKADKRLQNASIQTDVTGKGAVLLRGTVKSKQQSQIAEQLAATVSGVNKVQNELQIPRGE